MNPWITLLHGLKSLYEAMDAKELTKRLETIIDQESREAGETDELVTNGTKKEQSNEN